MCRSGRVNCFPELKNGLKCPASDPEIVSEIVSIFDQPSYTVRSHGSAVDLGSLSKHFGSTTTPEQTSAYWITRITQGTTYPSVLDLFRKKNEAVSSISPRATG